MILSSLPILLKELLGLHLPYDTLTFDDFERPGIRSTHDEDASRVFDVHLWRMAARHIVNIENIPRHTSEFEK